MKKIMSFTLALILLISACVSASAIEVDSALEQKFYDYCVEVLPEDMKPTDSSKVRIEGSLEADGVDFFIGRCGNIEKNSVYKVIGDWRVYSGYTHYPYDLGIYVSSGDEIYTLEETYEAGYVTDLSSLQYHQLGGSDYLTFVNVKNEDKYADLVLPMFFGQNASDFGMYVSYYEGYEYFSSDNEATGDEATADYVLLSIYTNSDYDMITAEIYDGYIMRGDDCGMTPYTFGKCVYVPSEHKLYSIGSAFSAKIEGIEKIFTEAGLGDLIGDVDKDRKLTIKDATEIQKCIAGLSEFSKDDKIYEHILNINSSIAYLSDFNRDGERNIKDATAIQKHIAGLEY